MKSFLRWVETAEDGSPALSEPQDKKGEINMNLAKVVENRIKSIIQELGPDGDRKGSPEEILAAIADYAGKMGGNNKEPAPQQQAPQDQALQGNTPASNQGMQMNPVASGNVSGNM